MKYELTYTSKIEIEASSKEEAIENFKNMHYAEIGEFSNIQEDSIKVKKIEEL